MPEIKVNGKKVNVLSQGNAVTVIEDMLKAVCVLGQNLKGINPVWGELFKRMMIEHIGNEHSELWNVYAEKISGTVAWVKVNEKGGENDGK